MPRRKAECFDCECGAHTWARTNRWGVVLVDTIDRVHLASVWTLNVVKDRLAYAIRMPRRGRQSALHRLILGLRDRAVVVDHENRNGLDCRRNNMRPCSQAHNSRNRVKKRGSKSMFLGVSYSAITPSCPWFSRIMNSGKAYNIGRFSSEDDAGIAYNIHAAYLHGEFARPNVGCTWRHD